jgi:hypothetical protein
MKMHRYDFIKCLERIDMHFEVYPMGSTNMICQFKASLAEICRTLAYHAFVYNSGRDILIRIDLGKLVDACKELDKTGQLVFVSPNNSSALDKISGNALSYDQDGSELGKEKVDE